MMICNIIDEFKIKFRIIPMMMMIVLHVCLTYLLLLVAALCSSGTAFADAVAAVAAV